MVEEWPMNRFVMLSVDIDMPGSIREPHLDFSSGVFQDDIMQSKGSHITRFSLKTSLSWTDWMMLLIWVTLDSCCSSKYACWIKDALSTAILFCTYILQRLLKHIIKSLTFGKPRSIREPHLDFSLGVFQDDMRWTDWMMLLIWVTVDSCCSSKYACWIKAALLTAILFRTYILQLLLEHIKSLTFGKQRTEKIAAFGSSSTGRGRFIMDSGASLHFVGNPSMLKDIRPIPDDQPRRVTLADDSCLPIVGIGTLLFTGLSECGSYTRSYRVPNVRYVRGLAMNVISVGQLDKEHGLCSAFHSEKCEIVEAGGTVIGQAVLVNSLYEVIYLHVP